MTEAQLAATPRTASWQRWLGLVASALPILMMLFSAALKFVGGAEVVDAFTGKFGFPARLLPVIGALELVCAALYALPATSVLGAILVCAYLGGAVVTHVRVGDPGWFMGVVLGVLAWAGLYLREPRLRALLPLRRADPQR